MDTFVPVDFLNDDEKKLLKETKKRIENCNENDLKYFEMILDLLMKQSFQRKKTLL